MNDDGRDTASEFTLVYEGFDPGEEGLREALTSTGNGYFCHSWRRGVGGRRGRALPGHLCAWRL